MDILDKMFNGKDLMHKISERSAERTGKVPEFRLFKICKRLDDDLNGLQRGKLIVIAGRVSNGKTALMVDIAYNLIMQQKKVAFLSLEMEAIDIAERLVSRGLKLNQREIQTGNLQENRDNNQTYEAKWQYLYKIMANYVGLENVGSTFTELEQTVIKYLNTHDVIIIDYIQMIKGSATAKEAIEEYIKRLRELAIKQNKVIIIGSQINRAGASDITGERIPSMSEMKSAGAIEEVADVILIGHWKYAYTKNIDEINQYKLILAKNRCSGRTGMYDLNFYPQCYKFSEDKDAQLTGTSQNCDKKAPTTDETEDKRYNIQRDTESEVQITVC